MGHADPRELSELFAVRVSAGDVDGAVELYEEDATFVAPDGSHAVGLAAIRERIEQIVEAGARLAAIGGGRAVVCGDIALIQAPWELSFGDGPAVRGTSAEVVRRGADGVWRYVIDNPVVDHGS
jgi:ketosteroid isomerase-like protein